jgi:hypothetical protein
MESNQPVALTEHTLRARWLEGEVLRMKRLGFSYEVIAQQITEVGRGPAQSEPNEAQHAGYFDLLSRQAPGISTRWRSGWDSN